MYYIYADNYIVGLLRSGTQGQMDPCLRLQLRRILQVANYNIQGMSPTAAYLSYCPAATIGRCKVASGSCALRKLTVHPLTAQGVLMLCVSRSFIHNFVLSISTANKLAGVMLLGRRR